MTRLDEIRARLEATTPGPWRTFDETEAHILFVKHAPDDLRLLLDVAEAAKELLACAIRLDRMLDNETGIGPYEEDAGIARARAALAALDGSS